MTKIRFVLLQIVVMEFGCCLTAGTLNVPDTIGVSSNPGNVGIGTTSPGSKLHVAGIYADEGADRTPSTVLTLDTLADGSGIGKTYFKTGWDNSTNNGLLTVGVGSYVSSTQVRDVLTLRGNGNVGIGTTNPSEKLSVHGVDNATPGVLSLASSREDAQNVEVGRVSGKNGATEVVRVSMNREGGSATGFLGLWTKQDNTTAIAERIRITGSGNVGIGTTNPMQKFSVIGGTLNVGAEGDYYGAWIAGGQSVDSYLGLGTWHSQAGYIKWFNVARRLALYTTSVGEPLTLQESGGNVGIGTINPTQKLSVNGTVRAKEVIVDTAWSDFVFAPDYALASLSEVEAHIKDHRRLPGIPSASEVTEHGISIGEMQAKLLAKIEELTLHQIEQEKQLTQQREEIRGLRSDLDTRLPNP